MKKVTILVLLFLCVLPVRAQNRFRAAVIEPAAPPYSTRIRTRTGSTRTKSDTGAWRKSSSTSPLSSPAG